MSTSDARREKRAAARAAAKSAATPPIPGDIDRNDPDASPPATALEQDIFNIAALVNTVKATFRVKEETALRVVDLGVTILLTTKQLQAQGIPFGAKVLTPEELAARETAAIEDAAPEPSNEDTE